MNAETLTYGIFILLIGLSVGSFLNVVSLRGLTGESIVFPPSKCPKCQKKLNWYTNIPVISYIFLKGKCQFCNKPISLQYPFVEAINAILYLTLYLNFGLTLKTFFLCALISIFILICVTDFKERVIFDIHTYIMMALGLLYNLFHLGQINIWQSILGIVCGFVIFELFALIGKISINTRAFGFGDTLIAMGLGAFFGWKMLLVITFLSVIIQALIALPVLFIKYLKQKNYKNALAYVLIAICLASARLISNLDYNHFLIALIALCGILLWCLYTIFANLKKAREQNDFLYMPFGPALVFSALIMIFYSKEILSFLI